VYFASNELRRAAKTMTPPWPNKAFNFGRHAAVRHVRFSPSGSQLAFYINSHNAVEDIVRVWDRWGKETLLGGHNSSIRCLEYSLDGKYLASGSGDESIRIWHVESFHNTASKPHMERPTRTPKQADKIISGSRNSSTIMELSFSRTDSNLLASGGSDGEIKVWNVKELACIHSFESHGGSIRSVFFAGGAEIACLAVAQSMSVIRLWKAEGSSAFASETIGEADQRELCARDALFSPGGSFLATSFNSRTGNDSTVALYELETMNKTQSVVMPRFVHSRIAVTSDSKQLVIVGRRGGILLQTDDLSIQRDLDPRKELPNMPPVCSVAFDPTCRVLAFGCDYGRLELRSL
jgi:WD40 repeat protein